MDKLRLNEKNKVQNELRLTQSLIKRNNETIERLSSIQDKTGFNQKQIEKINQQQKTLQEKIDELNIKIEDITTGKYDKEIKDTVDIRNTVQKEKYAQQTTKKNLEKELKQEKEKFNRDIDYKNNRRSNEINIQKENERFIKEINYMPDYISQNLKEMPSNKGYIWKGLYCYGEKPPESNTMVLFEKLRGGVLKIHEINNDFITINEKNGNQKKLISKKKRQNLFTKEELQKIRSYIV